MALDFKRADGAAKDDEHARALEEQWIEGDLTADTATSEFFLRSPSVFSMDFQLIANSLNRFLASTEGMYTSIFHGLLTGFLFPLMPWFFFRETPLPNFFDADAEATQTDETPVSERVSSSPGVGGEVIPGVVFGKRMQVN